MIYNVLQSVQFVAILQVTSFIHLFFSSFMLLIQVHLKLTGQNYKHVQPKYWELKTQVSRFIRFL